MKPLKNKLLKKIFSKPRRDDLANGMVALSPLADGIAMAHIIGSKPGEIFLQSHRFSATTEQALQLQAVQDYVDEYQLLDLPCSYVLPFEKYVIGMIAAPAGDWLSQQAQVRQAVQDFVDYPVNEAVIDCFQLPFKRTDDNQNVAYAVIAHADTINAAAEFVQETGLLLRYIDIAELSLRNIAMLQPDCAAGAVLLRLYNNGGHIVLMRDNSILMTRRIDVAVADLLAELAAATTAGPIAATEKANATPAHTTVGQAGGTAASLPLLEALTLDLQRSIDYCSSMFHQPAINSVLLAQTGSQLDILQKNLARELNATILPLNLAELLQYSPAFESAAEAQCMLAIGAALRQTMVPQP